MQKSLRHYFLLDKLRKAADEGPELELELVREIIKGIKMAQLRDKRVATDEMVIGVLNDVLLDHETKVKTIRRYLSEASTFLHGQNLSSE